jgi:hypothetical protein
LRLYVNFRFSNSVGLKGILEEILGQGEMAMEGSYGTKEE